MARPENPSRRSVALGLAGSAISAPFYIRPSWALAQTIVIGGFGGEEAAAKRRIYYDPFTKATGIKVITVPGVDLARMKIQVAQKNVDWDVVDLNDGWVPTAVRMGLLERVDEKIVDQKNCIPQARHAYAIGRSVYSFGIAFPTNRLNGRVPKTWQDFWNPAIPGRRGLRDRITDTLEFALMGDGVPPSHVYPCDVERGFRSLDRIKPYVTNWIAQSQQTVSLIERDEADFTCSYSMLVLKMQQAKVPIGYSFHQNILGIGYSGVLRGTRNRDAAMRLLAFMLDRDRQVEYSNFFGVAPTRMDAVSRVDPQIRKWLPQIDNPDNLFTNSAWWDGRVEELNVRFKEWLLV